MLELAQILVGAIKLGAIYALAATGLVVIHKATKVVNFAHGAFVMLGAYVTYALLVRSELPYWSVYLLAPLLVGALAAAAEWGILRPLRRVDFFPVVLATIFLGIAIVALVRRLYESDLLAVPPVVYGQLAIGALVVSYETLWIAAGALAAGVAAALLFSRSGVGRGMRAMAADPRGAELCGYSVNAVYGAAWFAGGTLAGLAGVFVAPPLGVSPELAVSMLVPAFVAAVLGGFDSLKGAIVGGLILGLAETLSAFYISSAMKSAVAFMLLFGILMLRPAGLFPERLPRRV